MKKITIILACMLSCVILFTGCTGQKESGDQEPKGNSGAEAGITGKADSTDDPAGSDPSSDDFTYNLKDPENNDGIVVRPKE